MDPKQILIVEDDQEILDLLANLLSSQGYTVHCATNGSETFRLLKDFPIDLVTLDLGLNGEDGLVLARALNSVSNASIIIISAKADYVDRIVGLEVGADDYIVKPFNLREVLARVRAVLRRNGKSLDSKQASLSVTTFGEWTLNLDRRELRKSNNELVVLTSAEYDLLVVLAQRPSRILTRETLLDLTRGSDARQYDRSIDTLIARLRKKIEPDPNSPIFIKTIRGVGYIFSFS
jgi:two-component system, OmpR family, response regulator